MNDFEKIEDCSNFPGKSVTVEIEIEIDKPYEHYLKAMFFNSKSVLRVPNVIYIII